MALLTDDCDLHETYLTVTNEGNGDWYVTISDKDRFSGDVRMSSVRISTSGGLAPTDVKIAVAELGRAMEKHKLNEPAEFKK